jgi:hypothetical protein
LSASQTAVVRGEASALRGFANTISPAKNYASAWRTAQGLPSGDDIPTNVETS